MGEIIDGVDMRAEVALLSRNILIHGEMEKSCYGNNLCQFYSHDTYGGHIKVGFAFVCICPLILVHVRLNSSSVFLTRHILIRPALSKSEHADYRSGSDAPVTGLSHLSRVHMKATAIQLVANTQWHSSGCM